MKTLSSFLLAAACMAIPLAAQDDGVDLDSLYEDDFEVPIKSINDPLAPVNRVIFVFNDKIYTHAAKPFANFYRKAMPVPVQKGIGNVFDNVKYPSRLAGNLLQGKLKRASQETGRFLVNTTVGIGGLFDPAKDMDNLNPPAEDIGQAFGKWGIGHGFYIVLPFIGPSSLRDLAGDFADGAVEPIPTPWSAIDNSGTRLTLRIVDNVNSLPFLMDLYDSMERSAIDPYASVRDAYTQQRARAVAE